jgi:hypothetical protein
MLLESSRIAFSSRAKEYDLGTAHTLFDALIAALRHAGEHNPADQVAPAAILWPDKERQWVPLISDLRQRLPLLTLGGYDPDTRTGPAYYVRCMIARTLAADLLPVDAVPIIYLPGISRQELRAIEECPDSLQPLAELQYRGVLWTHRNGRDWTVAAFLQNADAGLDVAVRGIVRLAMRYCAPCLYWPMSHWSIFARRRLYVPPISMSC